MHSLCLYAGISLIVRWSEAPVWGRGGFVCSFVLSANKVQDVVSFCWKMDVLMKLGKNSFKISMIKISCEDDETIWVCCLLFTDGLVQFIQCRISIAAVVSWGYISSNQQNRTYLPGQVRRLVMFLYCKTNISPHLWKFGVWLMMSNSHFCCQSIRGTSNDLLRTMTEFQTFICSRKHFNTWINQTYTDPPKQAQ